MSKPIATLGDMHSCPRHRGGPVVQAGQSHVKLNGIPFAVQGGSCLCNSSRSDGLASGASRVRINGQQVMRIGDSTSHGGRITTGKSGVTIE